MEHKHLITKLLDVGAGIYDPLLRVAFNEQEFKKKLIELAKLKGNEKVLDIGCGTGTFDLMLAKALQKDSIFGIDISPKMAAIARSKAERNNYKINYRIGSSTDLPYGNEEFDVIFTSLMYHHLNYGEKQRTLNEIHRVLKQDGRYVSIEFGGFPKDIFHTMIVGFTRSSGTLHGMHPYEMMKESGFDVVEEMKGPAFAGHHQTHYRVLRKK